MTAVKEVLSNDKNIRIVYREFPILSEAMLNQAMSDAGVVLELKTSVKNIKKSINFEIELNTSSIMSESLVIATGGKSIPKMGATAFGYKIAEQFGLS